MGEEEKAAKEAETGAVAEGAVVAEETAKRLVMAVVSEATEAEKAAVEAAGEAAVKAEDLGYLGDSAVADIAAPCFQDSSASTAQQPHTSFQLASTEAQSLQEPNSSAPSSS